LGDWTNSEIKSKKAPRKNLNPLEPSFDHLWETLFHRLLQMGKGWLFGKPSQRGEQQLKNTLMAIGSQGNNWGQFDDTKMIEIVIYQIDNRP